MRFERRPRFLITGAFGAIGAWTIRSLLDRGHFVVALDLGTSTHRLRIALQPGQLETLPTVQCDITDLDAVRRVMDEYDITNVIHLAALQVPFVQANPVLGAKVNVLGTLNLLEAVRQRQQRMSALVYASSIAVYGAAGTLDGGDPVGTLYGVYKRTNESTARRYYEDFGVSSIGLRPHTVYGPGRDQGLTSAPTTALIAAAAGVAYEIPFGGSAQMQFTQDVGEAFARTGLLEYEGASVHNLDGPVIPMGELARLIGAEAPDAAGLITCDGPALPFPAHVDGASFVELLGGSVLRSVENGVTTALGQFSGLIEAGLVTPPAPRPSAMAGQ